MSPEWMEENVPITVRGWEEEDEALADKQEELKGFWLLSPEKRERTVRLFWVSHTGGFAPKPFPLPWSQCIATSTAGLPRPCFTVASAGERRRCCSGTISAEVERLAHKAHNRPPASHHHR